MAIHYWLIGRGNIYEGIEHQDSGYLLRAHIGIILFGRTFKHFFAGLQTLF